jgi:soluble lytic murein transglycosylase-like protein
VALVTLASGPARAWADIYTYTDREGVVHFTNEPGVGRRWKILYRTGPDKASSLRGASDVIPARDRSAERYHRFDAHIREASAHYAIPEALIRAVIEVESDYDPRVVSSAGARGLMQLMPGTQRDMSVADIWDPRDNILGGTRYLRILANRFGGDLVRTIAGYHAGPSAVERYRGLPPYETTVQYVQRVSKLYATYRTKLALARPVQVAEREAVGSTLQ